MISGYAILVNTIYRTLRDMMIRKAKKLEKEGKLMPEQKPREPVPFEPVNEKTYRIEKADLNGCEGEVVIPVKPSGKYILYIHGGGFSGGSARERRSITTYLAEKYGFTVYANDYRLAPKYKLPVLEEDCLNYYLGILETGVDPQKLLVMGESAGGHLVLTLGLRLRDKGLPQPKTIGSFSPVVEFIEPYPSRTENAKTDYMLGDGINHTDWADLFGCGPEGWTDPYVSPIRGDFTGVAPIFIGVSDYETLYDDSRMLYQKLKKDGHKTELDIQHGLVHAFIIFGKMREARNSAAKFLRFAGMTEQ